MAEFLVKMADERGNVLEQVDNGFSEQEVRDRYAQQGYLVYSVKGRTGLFSGALFGGKSRIKTDRVRVRQEVANTIFLDDLARVVIHAWVSDENIPELFVTAPRACSDSYHHDYSRPKLQNQMRRCNSCGRESH